MNHRQNHGGCEPRSLERERRRRTAGRDARPKTDDRERRRDWDLQDRDLLWTRRRTRSLRMTRAPLKSARFLARPQRREKERREIARIMERESRSTRKAAAGVNCQSRSLISILCDPPELRWGRTHAKGSRTPVVQGQNSGLKLKRRLWSFVDQSKPTEQTGVSVIARVGCDGNRVRQKPRN